jgi:PAS domain-containing protein
MKMAKGITKKRLLLLKIDLPVVLAFIFFAGLIFLYLIPGFEKVMMERKRTMLQEISSSAYSLLTHFHSMETSGTMTRDEAMELAKSSVGSIRYGSDQKDYFWITDLQPVMIEHPYRKDLNGKDLSDFRDSKGKVIFVEFVNAVSATGESYVDYMWQWNDDSTRIVPKLSYVRLFKPWGWIIGTGIYIEDVKAEIRKIEYRALIISGIIAAVIIILLTAVTRQSHRIEQERKKTEEELIRSKDLYKTLAEAATEGVLIWSANRIQANKTLLSWLGFREDELIMMNLEDIMVSKESESYNDSDSYYETLQIRRYGECELKTRDGNGLKVHADFSRIILGDKRAVMVVVKPVRHSAPSTLFSVSPDLINSAGTGFFRISLARKNRFLLASATVLKMLGYNNIDELASVPVESLFVSRDQFRMIRRSLASGQPVINMAVTLKNSSGYQFIAMVSVVITEHNYPELWCDGTVEYLAEPEYDGLFNLSVPSHYYSSFILEAPVISIVNPSRDNPPEVTMMIGSDKKISWAYDMMSMTGQKSIAVTTPDGKIAGSITGEDIINAFLAPEHIFNSVIQGADSAVEYKKAYTAMKRTAIAMILGKADPLTVSSFVSLVADKICEKVISNLVSEAGPPPCSFSFIQTGSAGRMEQTLFTDQDNGIIFGDCEGEQLQAAYRYFSELGGRINAVLAETGYNLCKGNNMAGNPLWCQPLRVWKQNFSGWIRNPDPQNLLEISIFFDFRHCAGDRELTESLRDYISNDLTTNDIFFHHMAAAWKDHNPSPELSEAKKTDIKRILMPLTGLIRLYTLKHGIISHSTSTRLISLYTGGHFDRSLLRDSLKALRDLTNLRLRHQASALIKGEEVDNTVDSGLAGADFAFLVKMAIESVNNLMLKAGSDFYVTTI